MKLKYRLFLAMAVFASAAATSLAVGPREPLTSKDVGLYCGWNDYFVSKDSPFDFLIVQAGVVDGRVDGSATKSWNQWLKQARAGNKRVIADISAVITGADGKQVGLGGLYTVKDPPPLKLFLAQFDKFFQEVDEQDLYAVTIGEEHVFWGGQKERLAAVYHYLKKKYNVPIFQWYSPSHDGSTVGLNWPNLPSDGWGLDEYFLQQPALERSMRMYALMRKPAFQIMWAAPDMPSAPWSPQTFWQQYEVCRKYDIPIAFFTWSGRNKTSSDNTWGWSPKASPKMRDVFENYCEYGARLAKRLAPVSPAQWDFVPWAQKQIPLKVNKEDKTKATYHDAFAREREIATLWTDAGISGFANLAWDSTPLQFKPRSAGSAESTIRYCFDSPAKIKEIHVRIAGKTSGGTVEAQITNPNGAVLAKADMKDGLAEIRFVPNEDSDKYFVVNVLMQGDAQQPDQLLAEFADISVDCQLAK